MGGGWERIGRRGRRGRRLVLGDGADLLLVGSPLARGECYLPTARALSSLGRVTLVEMPGSGPSEKLRPAWGVPEYAGWLAEVSPPGRPVVLGHSYAGMVAVVFAAEFPERCGPLVVVDAPGMGPLPPLRTVAGALVDAALDFGLVLRMGHLVLANVGAHARESWAGVRESLAADVRDAARRVRSPALVAWGAGEHTLPPRQAEAYAACLPGAEVYLSPVGTHTWPVSQAAEFARAVGGFLARQRVIEPVDPVVPVPDR